jgi:hypothetical protein
MRELVCAIGALLAAAGAALPAAAQTQPKQPRPYAKKAPIPPAAPLPRGDGYREQLADKLPIGSQAWWDQMQREGRLGGETP